MRVESARASLTMYTREGCHLCSVMEDELRALIEDAHVSLRVVDVDSDPALQERFGEWVPVLLAGELELCHYHLKHDRVREYLSQFS